MSTGISSANSYVDRFLNGSGSHDAFSAREGRKGIVGDDSAFAGQQNASSRTPYYSSSTDSSVSTVNDRDVYVSSSNDGDKAASSYPVKYKKTNGEQLDSQEIALLEQLKNADQSVRRHEAAHVAAGGSYVTKGASFSYATGPDGNRYAVAGEVSIDTSKEREPQATLAKMRTVQRAALAPIDPSPQDRAVAAMAAQMASEAMLEIARLQYEKNMSSSNPQAANSQGKQLDIYV